MHISSNYPQVKSAFQIAFVFVLLLFADSLNKMVRAQSEHDNVDYAKDMRTGIYQLLSTDTFQHAKMFYAQRNLYLTGSVLFLGLILNRFHSMITELVKGTENSEVLKSQVESLLKLCAGRKDKQRVHENARQGKGTRCHCWYILTSFIQRRTQGQAQDQRRKEQKGGHVGEAG